jgi:hypothetical protein
MTTRIKIVTLTYSILVSVMGTIIAPRITAPRGNELIKSDTKTSNFELSKPIINAAAKNAAAINRSET